MAVTRAERKRIDEKKAKKTDQIEPRQKPTTARKNRRKRQSRTQQKSRPEARDGGPQQNDRYSSSESSEPDEATQIFEWHGIPLPQFEIPQWETIAGIPTIVLKPGDVDARLIPTNGSHDPSEDPGTDAGRDDEAVRDNDSEAYDDNADVHSLAVEEPSSDGVTRDFEIGKIGYHLSKFIHSPFGPEAFFGDGWQGVKPLGKGGFGMAGMWERRGEDNDIVDRMVIKQIGKHRSDKDKAWDPSHPLEVELMRALKAKANIVQIKGYRRYLHQEVHRIYMEYCSFGDLHGLITEYRARRQYMPEPFICHVFLHLARACQALLQPHSPKSDPTKYKDQSRNMIAHLDIKPRNVFLGESSNERVDNAMRYPEVKLGDFGVGRFTGVADKRNPWAYRGQGTEGYKALEMEAFDKKDLHKQYNKWPHVQRGEQRHLRYENEDPNYDLHRPMILSHTNIWGVGAVMYDIMTLKQVKHYLYQTRDSDNDNEDDGEEEEQPTIRDGLRNTGYHKTLTTLVQQCLSDLPKNRPDISYLISTLEDFAATKRNDWHNPESLAEQTIPWGNFKTALATGDWESSAKHSAYTQPESSFLPTPGEKKRCDEDRPARQARRKERQERRNEERKRRREEGEEDVSSDEMGSPPDTKDRKLWREKKRKG
ncbi:MAG: hypothetical protein Q9213_008413, partial [Squamulea squamosa]